MSLICAGLPLKKKSEASGKPHIASCDRGHNNVHPNATLASQTSFGKAPWPAQFLKVLSKLHCTN